MKTNSINIELASRRPFLLRLQALTDISPSKTAYEVVRTQVL